MGASAAKQRPEGNVLTAWDRRPRESSFEKGRTVSPSEACVGIGDASELAPGYGGAERVQGADGCARIYWGAYS
jgi:hypothetical protein